VFDVNIIVMVFITLCSAKKSSLLIFLSSSPPLDSIGAMNILKAREHYQNCSMLRHVLFAIARICMHSYEQCFSLSLRFHVSVLSRLQLQSVHRMYSQ